ncbi:MAG TPA: hypothetical protein VLV78_06385 [Thermoanaerobaculia bacterium]|nr:hypothetical protein [Thermoanaerobaculia bacterium]
MPDARRASREHLRHGIRSLNLAGRARLHGRTIRAQHDIAIERLEHHEHGNADRTGKARVTLRPTPLLLHERVGGAVVE